MQVKRDFDEVYATQDNPWQIGMADDPRYDLYRATILEHASSRGSMLDIGCGFGAFLARFHGEFDALLGVDVSRRAVSEGAQRHPYIRYLHGSATRLDDLISPDEHFDAIICSDIIAYFRDREKRNLVRWIAEHLAADGVAFIAAWCPGGKYLTPPELRRLVDQHLAIDSERVLASEHALFVCSRRRWLVSLTVDHETWQPVPDGRKIDWETDVLAPTTGLLDVCEEHGLQLTVMAEAGEHLWLQVNEPAIAERIEEQWRDAVRRGHDVQLHLHPNWLPELGARRDGDNWSWDSSVAIADDYPGDLAALLARCRDLLEQAVVSAAAGHRVVCFRAGTYEAQPFERLRAALEACGIRCDSSVYAGHLHPERRYDYRLAYSGGQPYYAARTDPQLLAPPAERGLVELPPFTPEPGVYWTFDSSFGGRFGRMLLARLEREEDKRSTESLRRRRAAFARLRQWCLAVIRRQSQVSRLVPRRLGRDMFARPTPVGLRHRYHVLVGHSKGDLDLNAIDGQLSALATDGRVEFVTLTEMERLARADLEVASALPALEDPAALSFASPPKPLHDLVPLDRSRIVEIGPSDLPSERRSLATSMTWASVRSIRALDQLPNLIDGAADCICVDHLLERLADPDAALKDLRAGLRPGGILVAAVRSDARRPSSDERRHRWKTAPHDVATRATAAGFTNVEVIERNTRRFSSAVPYPPSDDHTTYLRAWRRDRPATQIDRLDELMAWVYSALTPERPVVDSDPAVILSAGSGWCLDYTVVLGHALRREGVDVRWVSMLAADHPRGRGKRGHDSHEVLEVTLADGEVHLVDAMANIRFPNALVELLRDPVLANVPRAQDDRYVERQYELYTTAFWYERVIKVDIRRSPNDPARLLSARRLTQPSTLDRRLLKPRSRPLRRALRAGLASARAFEPRLHL